MQPLSSNVLGKEGPGSGAGGGMGDQQYMQTSSQLYVFSTQWANQGARAVMNNEYPSIIAWHESQPETKKHLEVSNYPIRGFSMCFFTQEPCLGLAQSCIFILRIV